jgi:plastocyanin
MKNKSKFGLSTAGPLLALLIVVSMGTFWYFQFDYLPRITAIEVVPENIANPTENVKVDIVKGAYNPSQKDNYVPKEITIVLGKNNKIIWTNSDEVAHTVTADPGQSGSFVTTATRSNFMQGGDKWEFVFTKPGTWNYHCEPHPYMKGTVIVTEGQ